MPIRVTCECGKAYSVKDELAGKTVRCKACGETLRIPDPRADADSKADESGPYLAQAKAAADLIRCPNCGRTMPRTLETCRHCGKSLRRNLRRTVFAVVAVAVFLLLVVVALVVFMIPSRKEVVSRKAEQLATALKTKNWAGVYELDIVRASDANSADYIHDRETQFQDLEIKEVAVGEVAVDSAGGGVISEITVRAQHKTAQKPFSGTFKIEWKKQGGLWLAFLGQSNILKKLREHVDASKVEPEKVCENCKGTGRATCNICKGKGRLPDQSWCRDCHKMQGWIVCPVCKGTGKSAVGGDAGGRR